MRRTKTFAVILSLFFLLALFSRADEGKEEPPRWKGDISLGLSLARGNARSSSFSFTFAADGPVNKAHTLMWANRAIYLFGEVDGETSAESFLAVSRFDWQHSSRIYSYYEIQGIRDRFKNYSFRFLPAAGLGYKVIAAETLSLGLDVGLSQVFTKFYDSGDTESYTGLKIGQQFVWDISETSELNEKLEMNPQLSSFRRYFLRLEANLIAAIAKSWSVKLTFIDNYDNEPVGPGIKKNDITFIAGLSWKF